MAFAGFRPDLAESYPGGSIPPSATAQELRKPAAASDPTDPTDRADQTRRPARPDRPRSAQAILRLHLDRLTGYTGFRANECNDGIDLLDFRRCVFPGLSSRSETCSRWSQYAAVVLTLLRTPVGLVVLAFMIALPGFLLERSRGGSGILGGALSSGLIAGAIWTVCTPYFFAYATSVGDAVYQFFHMLYFVVLAAFVCGGIWSAVLWVIVTPVTAVSEP